MHVPTTLPGPLEASDALPATYVKEARVIGTAQIVEFVLKDRRALDWMLCATHHKVELATRFLGIALASFVLFGMAMALICDAAALWPQLTPTAKWIANPSTDVITFEATPDSGRFLHSWLAGPAERLVIAYAFGLIAASCVCLPSLYFFSLLSGLQMTFPEVVLHTLKAKSVAAVALVGLLPIYTALVLGAVIFQLPAEIVRATLLIGLGLPFLAGLWGTRSLYVGFGQLCDTMPPEFQTKRACFLRRLVFAWCGCYTAVAPVMIATVWQHLGV